MTDWLDGLFIVSVGALGSSLAHFLMFKAIFWARRKFAEWVGLVVHFLGVAGWIGVLFVIAVNALPPINAYLVDRDFEYSHRAIVVIGALLFIAFPYYPLFSKKVRRMPPYGASKKHEEEG